MRLEDYDLIKPQVLSLVSLHMAEDPELLGDVMTFPRSDMSPEDKIEYVTHMLMYQSRMIKQLLEHTWHLHDLDDWLPMDMWRDFCALRA